jgi:molybdopterin-guanine dinucleotide biosynthesis protein A
MAENQITGVAAVVLAGGASSRMGASKALLAFAGQPLAARALARLKRQADAVYLNVREQDPVLASLGAPLVPDPPQWRGAGPLAGIAAALRRVKADGFAYLATAPCDAPFLPLDLIARLTQPVAEGARAAAAVSACGLEPMFALWPVDAIDLVEAALAAGRASPRSVLQDLRAAEVLFALTDGRDPFANLNTPQEFAAAEALIRGDLLEADQPALAGTRQGDQT